MAQYDNSKEVVLKKRYRVFVRDDNEQVIGIDPELFEYTPIVEKQVNQGTEEEPDWQTVTSGGDLIPKEGYLTDFGTSTTTTWVTGKYYEDKDWEKVLDKYMKKGMSTNA